MINWKELEKFITPGKVCTLVIIVDGKEIGAFSFNIETLAYKESLESKPIESVKIADKPVVDVITKAKETAVSNAKKPELKKVPVDKKDRTKAHPDFNPTPATAEKTDDEVDGDGVPSEPDQWRNEDDDDSDVDKTTGEIKEIKVDPTLEQVKAFEDERQPENLANKSHPVHMENDFNPPAQKKTIEPVAAATLEDEDIIPEKIIVTDKKETVKENVKNEKVQEPAKTGNTQTSFTEEQW